MSYFRRIDNPQEGELVQFLAVYATRWPWEAGEPSCAFVEDDDPVRAAAHDLLEAAEEVLSWHATKDSHGFDKLRAAIAKAKG